jgi:methionine aminotransferase
MKFTGTIHSKQPTIATSIFATMSALASEHQALNLSQGFPDFDISEEMISRVHHYMQKGFNQYAPMPGVPSLRKAISEMASKLHGITYDPATEITITAGATQAIFTAIAAFIRDDDEAIIFEPAYDTYAPAVKVNGGRVKYARLQMPDYTINWEQAARLISSHTRMIIINTPHNPSGAVLTAADMEQLSRLTQNTDILVLSDEVYEHLIFDGLQHESACRYPQLAQRSLVIGSFGKTFHATGWKTGYVMAPENLMKEFRKMHQWVVFAANTPIQMAIADMLADEKNYTSLAAFYQQKRDLFLQVIAGSRFKVVPSHGTYFQCLDYSAISDARETDFATTLVKQYKIAAIPVSPFYHDGKDDKILRFCFAKKEETIRKAGEIICKI